MRVFNCFIDILRIQPAVLLLCLSSVLAKYASSQLPKRTEYMPLFEYLKLVIQEWRFTYVVILTFLVLGIYAFIWQRLLKKAKIAVVYASKSSGILWGQLAAVLLFGEQLSQGSFLGLCVIFAGIILVNTSGKN